MYKVVKLNKWDLKRAKKFADERCNAGTSLYSRRGAFKIDDIINGALGEIAVYKLLQNNGIDCGKPDFTIHEVRKKSYDADLNTDKLHFHVKSQSIDSTLKYGASWIMQRTDPILREPKKGHFIVPCMVDQDSLEVVVHGIFSVKTLVNRECFDDCKLEFLNRTKIALYLDYIESTMTEKARWALFYRK